jgi:hypothetical protein
MDSEWALDQVIRMLNRAREQKPTHSLCLARVRFHRRGAGRDDEARSAGMRVPPRAGTGRKVKDVRPDGRTALTPAGTPPEAEGDGGRATL